MGNHNRLAHGVCKQCAARFVYCKPCRTLHCHCSLMTTRRFYLERCRPVWPDPAPTWEELPWWKRVRVWWWKRKLNPITGLIDP
jgi:hypothetical protein